MINQHGAKPTDFHLTAHSLGAAVAGYAGHRIVGLGRITGSFLPVFLSLSSISMRVIYLGLDPAGPFFENADPIVRLDPSDANFVDIIHTDGSPNLLLGFGQ